MLVILLQSLLLQSHLICAIPSYDVKTEEAVDVQVVVQSGVRHSDPVAFTYLPGMVASTLQWKTSCSIPAQYLIHAMRILLFWH